MSITESPIHIFYDAEPSGDGDLLYRVQDSQRKALSDAPETVNRTEVRRQADG